VRYLLDTCIIEALLKEETGHEKVRARIGAAPRGSLAISALTTVEIWTGVTGAPVVPSSFKECFLEEDRPLRPPLR
jgi:uncharacterized protein with PIN domain